VPRTRLELARPCEHWPLKPACLPIPTPGQYFFQIYNFAECFRIVSEFILIFELIIL
jgi:hypothetical protein